MTHVQDVADTAFLTTYARARETERAAPLFRDPLASKLLTERGRALGASVFAASGGSAMAWSIVTRTTLVDDVLTNALASGVTMVLNLGAGLDTRPYRMSLPATLTWLEVDQESIIAHKATCLADEVPRCSLERTALDLTHVQRRRALFESVASRRPASILVLTEGMVPYWSMETVAAFARDLRDIGNVGGWIVDHIPPHVVGA